MDEKHSAAKHEVKRAATLRDIARMVGVSPSTVSATLNDAPRSQHYATETKARIRAVATELGYYPNPLAKTLKKTNSNLMGVVAFSQYSTYYGRSLKAIDEAAREAGYEIITADLRYDLARLEQALHWLGAWRVEGLIVITGRRLIDAAVVTLLETMGVPFIMAGGWQPNASYSAILFDDAQGGWLVVEHLVALGHARIGVLAGHPSNLSSEERLRGINQAMGEHGLHLDEHCVIKAVDPDVGPGAGYGYAKQLLDACLGLTAVICMNDAMALGTIRCLRERDLDVPQDVSVTGFDDMCLFNIATDDNRLGEYVVPALTTVRTPIEEMGQAGVRMLLETLNDPSGTPLRRLYEFPAQLIVRDSTGPAHG